MAFIDCISLANGLYIARTRFHHFHLIFIHKNFFYTSIEKYSAVIFSFFFSREFNDIHRVLGWGKNNIRLMTFMARLRVTGFVWTCTIGSRQRQWPSRVRRMDTVSAAVRRDHDQ